MIEVFLWLALYELRKKFRWTNCGIMAVKEYWYCELWNVLIYGFEPSRGVCY